MNIPVKAHKGAQALHSFSNYTLKITPKMTSEAQRIYFPGHGFKSAGYRVHRTHAVTNLVSGEIMKSSIQILRALLKDKASL